MVVGNTPQVPAGRFTVILVRQGALRWRRAGEEKLVLPRGVLLLPPDMASTHLAGGTSAEILWLAFDRTLLEPDCLGRMVDSVRDLFQARSGSLAWRLAPDAFEDIVSLYRGVQAEERNRCAGFEQVQRLLVCALLVKLCRLADVGRSPSAARPAPLTMDEVARYLREHYSEDLSLPLLASRFGLNPSYLSRAFARHTGEHVIAHLNRVRVEKSCMLLKRSGMSVLEIASWVGYNNISHFNRYFRRITGLSPREYRSRAQR